MSPSIIRLNLARVALILVFGSTVLFYFHCLRKISFLPLVPGPIRSFTIDYERDAFLMNGQLFRFVSGEVHYFRTPRERWRDILRKTRAAGLNAVSTYVEWSFHEVSEGHFDFSGDRDLEHFIDLATQEGLFVLLRAGPFICGERDFGGLPSWLWQVSGKIVLRQNDVVYQRYVRNWFSVLFKKLRKFMFGYGGPIIMVQVENEYGMTTPQCDVQHVIWLRDLIKSFIGDSAVLYSIDPPHKRYMKCVIDGVYPTVDFGSFQSTKRAFKAQREVAPRGPLVNSEFYTGWLTHWGEKTMAFIPPEEVMKSLAEILDMGASVNIYMFFGGTNFGFTNGANMDKKNRYLPTVTSYDYDSPLDESGNPTEKYFQIRELLLKYFPLPIDLSPGVGDKERYRKVPLTPIASIFDLAMKNKPIVSTKPLSFEELGQSHGFVLYETHLPDELYCELCSFEVNDVRDRAQVFLNEELTTTLYRAGNTTAMLNVSINQKLSLLVENMGRINHYKIYDRKGILSEVALDNEELLDWKIYKFPLESVSDIESLQPTGNAKYPMFFSGSFEILTTPKDTYLDIRKWSKGVAFINDHNLGRYWSEVGPQYSLFVPREFLKVGTNRITIFELSKAPDNFGIEFVTQSLNTVLLD